jgi:hypothetical protein
MTVPTALQIEVFGFYPERTSTRGIRQKMGAGRRLFLWPS